MNHHEVISIRTGVPGSGKSYASVRYIVDEFLPIFEGHLFTNLPLGVIPVDHPFPPSYDGETFLDRIYKEVAERTRRPIEEFQGRIHLIPQTELKRWETGESNPLDYFTAIVKAVPDGQESPLQDGRIMLDEIHNFCSANHGKDRVQIWQQWFGEIRHWGCTLEIITQTPQEIPDVLRRKCAVELRVRTNADELDPFFGIPYGDWCELKAAFTRQYKECIYVKKLRSGIKGRWDEVNPNNVLKLRLEKKYFQFYNSHSAPHKGGRAASANKRFYERFSRKKLFFWFWLRNFIPINTRLAIFTAIVWLGFFGGMTTCLTKFSEYAPKIINKFTSVTSDHLTTQPKKDTSIQATIMPSNPISHNEKVLLNRQQNTKSNNSAISQEAYNKLYNDNKKLIEENTKLKEKVTQLENELGKSSMIVMMDKKEITLRNGYSYVIGEIIDYGELKGKKLQAIDWRRRTAIFNDGSAVRMGCDIGL